MTEIFEIWPNSVTGALSCFAFFNRMFFTFGVCFEIINGTPEDDNPIIGNPTKDIILYTNVY